MLRDTNRSASPVAEASAPNAALPSLVELSCIAEQLQISAKSAAVLAQAPWVMPGLRLIAAAADKICDLRVTHVAGSPTWVRMRLTSENDSTRLLLQPKYPVVVTAAAQHPALQQLVATVAATYPAAAAVCTLNRQRYVYPEPTERPLRPSCARRGRVDFHHG